MNITTVPYLLGTLGEESGEVQQAIGKILRFGLYDQHREKESNFLELRKEVHDLVAVYEMLCDEIDECSKLDPDALKVKKEKVRKYMRYSQEIGQLI